MSEYIKREDAVQAVMAAKWVSGSDGAIAMEIVAGAPAADVELVVHAHWEQVSCEGPAGPWQGTCSNCGLRNDIPHPFAARRCPNCGAKMDERTE